jgi:hypothetical protein
MKRFLMVRRTSALSKCSRGSGSAGPIKRADSRQTPRKNPPQTVFHFLKVVLRLDKAAPLPSPRGQG